MKRVIGSPVDEHLDELLRKDPALAREYAKQFAELPVPTQLAILRRRKRLSQAALARKLRVKQPHVARMERASHDPRLSSLTKQARALDCRLMLIPENQASKIGRLVALEGRGQTT